jgi:hypothetical protein
MIKSKCLEIGINFTNYQFYSNPKIKNICEISLKNENLKGKEIITKGDIDLTHSQKWLFESSYIKNKN